MLKTAIIEKDTLLEKSQIPIIDVSFGKFVNSNIFFLLAAMNHTHSKKMIMHVIVLQYVYKYIIVL